MDAGEKKDELIKMSGDYYQKQGKYKEALTAYQKVVTRQFEKNAVWQKIFELQSN